MSSYVALLRGINLGAANRILMKDLAAIFVEAGCGDVTTYIQSGNVVYSAPDGISNKIPSVISKALKDKFGFRIPVVTRSEDEMRQAIADNPYIKAGESEDKLHVYFLAEAPSAENAAKLEPERALPGRFILHKREVYVHLPNGMGRTKLNNAYLDSKLQTVSTARNWRTVLKLYEMLRA